MTQRIKSLIRRFFYRSALCRILVGVTSVLTGRTRALGISHLLSYVGADAAGPLQRDEAIALFGIVKTVRPQIVVEFGFFHGHSAFNFLSALDEQARLYSYDVAEEAANRARTELAFDRRLFFLHKSQAAFSPDDIDHQPVDLVFFDAAHDLALNIETFSRILSSLAPAAIIAVHDTGLWNKAWFSPTQEALVREGRGRWVSENLYAHQPDERTFVDWVMSNHPGFGSIHFHSTHTLRHGFSLLQRQSPLAAPMPAASIPAAE